MPKEKERPGSNAWQKANLLWDHYGFVLGHPATDDAKDVEKAHKQFGTFRQMVADLVGAYPDDQDLKAIHAFYEQEQYKQVVLDRKWPDCSKIKGCNLTFKIAGQEGVITDNTNVQSMAAAYWEQEMQEDEEGADEAADKVTSFCLISEETGPIARTHPERPYAMPRPMPSWSRSRSTWDSTPTEKSKVPTLPSGNAQLSPIPRH